MLKEARTEERLPARNPNSYPVISQRILLSVRRWKNVTLMWSIWNNSFFTLKCYIVGICYAMSVYISISRLTFQAPQFFQVQYLVLGPGVRKTGVGAGVMVFFFFFLKNAVLGLGLGLFRVRVRVSIKSNPDPKTAFFKKKIDPDPGPDPAFYWYPFLHHNVAFIFKLYGNSWNNIELAESVYWVHLLPLSTARPIQNEGKSGL